MVVGISIIITSAGESPVVNIYGVMTIDGTEKFGVTLCDFLPQSTTGLVVLFDLYVEGGSIQGVFVRVLH